MKTIFLGLCLCASPLGAFAQGTLNILNNLTGQFRAPIYGPQAGNIAQMVSGNSAAGIPVGSTVYTGPLLQGTGFTFAVYYGAVSVSDPSALTLLAFTTFRTGGAAGLINSQNGVVVPGINAGEQARLQIRVWENVDGTITSYDSSIIRGNSEMFLSAPLGGTTTNGSVPTPDMIGWSSFNIGISSAPEPSSLDLVGMAGLLFVFWRRRR